MGRRNRQEPRRSPPPSAELHVCDSRGVPLSLALSGANENERGYLLALVDAIPALRERRQQAARSTPRRPWLTTPKRLRESLRRRGIGASDRAPPRAGFKARGGQAPERWMIERTNAWLHNYRRVATRRERRPDLYLAFARPACSLIIASASKELQVEELPGP